jgi:capsid assembly protease
LDRDLIARFGHAPLALALEHVARFPKRGAQEETEKRARAFVLSAFGKRAGVMDGEFVWNTFTCGYFKRADGLAVIPVWGDLGPMRAFWPWVWYEDLAQVADEAAKDGDVKAILYHFDSPGGYVTGVAECAAAIEAAAALKPSAAFANDYATSAAYWLACAAGRVSAPTTGIVGSIGAIALHEEYSRALDEEGITINVIRSAPRKAESNPFEPLSAAARQQLQTEITVCADEFVAAIARLRGLDALAIKSTQAACLTADAALAGRFADSVENFDAACAALLARANPTPAAPPSPATGQAGAGPTTAPAAPSAKAQKPKAQSKNPARGKTAQPSPQRPRAMAQPKKGSIMDPTTLTPEEQIARYDEIAAIMAEAPADDAGKIGQFVQVAGIVNRPVETETEEAPAEVPAEEPAAARATAIAKSKEGQANPAAALAAIQAGLSLAQFKALAPTFGKQNGGFAARMGAEASAQRLGADASRPSATVQTIPRSADVYASRRKQAAGG